ncbi:MAG: hypothetical protein M3Y81_09095 [Chloroflexota bacterium]|nr:hypothetical protein [Chloroflexota bacterium]
MKQAKRTGIEVRIMKPSARFMGWQAKLQELDAPPRSRLYGLEPMNGGTVWSECLTSYTSIAWDGNMASLPEHSQIKKLALFLSMLNGGVIHLRN